MVNTNETLYSPLESTYEIKQFSSLVFTYSKMSEYSFIDVSNTIKQEILINHNRFTLHNQACLGQYTNEPKIKRIFIFNKRGTYEFTAIRHLNNPDIFHRIKIIVSPNNKICCSLL